MKTKVILFSFLVALVGFIPPAAFPQQDEDVRGAFLTTRPKATAGGNKKAASAKPSRKRPKATATKPAASSAGVKKEGPVPAGGNSAVLNVPRIGLGLTLFMRNSSGLAVRTNTSRQFLKGDHVRFLIETNSDGYLYIFNTTDGGKPVMIYPDPELDEAGNYFQSHVPFEIPSSLASEERLRWLTFDENPGAEKLYFVFTREPLPGVPIEDDLVTFCRDNDGKCPWQPGPETWAQIQSEVNEPVQVAKSEKFGKAQTAAEREAATRGIGLNRTDPEPSLVMLTASTSKNMLVAVVDLVHKAVSLLTDPGDDEGFGVEPK